MDAVEWSTSIYALAAAMARCMSTEELSRASLLLTQLGTTLGSWRRPGRASRRYEKRAGSKPALFL